MEGKGWAVPIPFTVVFDPSAKVTIERVEGVERVERVFLLPETWLEAPESRIHCSWDEDCVIQAKELPGCTVQAADEVDDCSLDIWYER